MKEVILTESNFTEEVLQYKGYVLVDFWASWCSPCRRLSPIISEIAERNPDIKVGKVNVEEEMALARKYRVMSIPYLILFKDGEPYRTHLGLAGIDEIESMWK